MKYNKLKASLSGFIGNEKLYALMLTYRKTAQYIFHCGSVGKPYTVGVFTFLSDSHIFGRGNCKRKLVDEWKEFSLEEEEYQ